jgi:mRNA interferase RelE/StbE
MNDESAVTEYEIRLTPLALEMLMNVKDRREQQKLTDRIEQLKK